MGTDTPLACLSDKPQPLFNYFKQLFAQVTNPPIDPDPRRDGDVAHQLHRQRAQYPRRDAAALPHAEAPHPILTNRDLEKLRRVSQGDFLATTLPTLFPADEGEKGLERALDQLCRRASLAIQSGYTLLILSDRGVDRNTRPSRACWRWPPCTIIWCARRRARRSR